MRRLITVVMLARLGWAAEVPPVAEGSAEMQELHGWLAAKFDGEKRAAPPQWGLAVLANFDELCLNTRMGQPLAIGKTAYARGVFCHAASKVAVPYIIYMPEKDRLLMLVNCDYPHHAEVLFSDDRGASWSSPKPAITGTDGNPVAGMGASVCYLGEGNVLFYGIARWFSRDHGQTWDLDHKYILHHWIGHIQDGPTAWYPSSQATSTVLLPDGSILTAFGTGHRCQDIVKGQPAPRDIGLVRWRLNGGALNTETKLREAPFDSDLRNVYDPGRH